MWRRNTENLQVPHEVRLVPHCAYVQFFLNFLEVVASIDILKSQNFEVKVTVLLSSVENIVTTSSSRRLRCS